MNTATIRKLFITGALVTLVACGPTEQPAEEEAAAAQAQAIELEGTNWQLVEMTVLGGFVFTAEGPAEYVLNFRSENRLTGTSDCNSINGSWFQDGTALRFEPFIASRKLCSPGSLHNNLALYLKDTTALEIREGNMFLSTIIEGVELEFESRD